MKTFHNAHLLVRYPRSSLKAERKRLEQESANRVKIAGELYSRALRLEEEGFREGAYLKLVQALEKLNGSSLHASSKTLSRLVYLKQQILELAQRLSFPLRRVAVEPVIVRHKQESGSKQDSILTEALVNALLNEGFHPERTKQTLRARALPRVVALCREEDSRDLDVGFYFSRWSAAIRVLDPRDDSVLLSEIYSAKGFGADPERAGLDAQRKLRVEVFGRFARMVRDKFDLTFGKDG